MTAALASNVTSLPRARPLPAKAYSWGRRGDGWSLVPVHALRNSPMDRRALLALRDPLTGLPNRTALTFIIDELIRCDRHGSVILLGLDGFKRLNEVAGHRIGDQLLIKVAAILCEQIEGNGGICRYGGSEFAIILPELTSRSEVGRIARRVCRYIDEGSKLANSTSVRARTGAAIFPGDVPGQSDLLQCAGIALRMAMQRPQSDILFYRPSMKASVRSEAAKLALARRCLATAHKLEVCFQPKLDLRSGTVSGYEALLRNRDPRDNGKAPAWIDAASADPELACAMGSLVLDRSLAFLAALKQRGMPGDHVALNVTNAELSTPRWARSLLKALDRQGLEPSAIEIEVHESVLLGNEAKQALLSLGQLHKAGVRISLDDFGTGHASLLHLRTLPVDALKIDRGFVANCHDPDSRAIIRAIIELARALHMSVVAEGIETEQQHQLLIELGCREGQGYYYGKAQPADRWLAGQGC
jgi:diguanylate cyclase (GGDEF)-like protein